MHFRQWGIVTCAALLISPCLANAAQQTALHLVNTSVGVKPTSSANKFKLETDPVLEGGNPSDYIPVDGMLNNYFDISQFALNIDSSGTYSVGGSVGGDLPFTVLSFQVQLSSGGYIQVNSNGGSSAATGVGDTEGGVPTGFVTDIHFQILPDEEADFPPLTSDQDQNFYHLFLNQIGNNPPGYDTTYATPDSYVTFDETQNAINNGLDIPASESANGPGEINPSATPEVSSASVLGIGALAMLARRRKARRAAADLAENSRGDANALPSVAE